MAKDVIEKYGQRVGYTKPQIDSFFKAISKLNLIYYF
jgi:hypothetical protein